MYHTMFIPNCRSLVDVARSREISVTGLAGCPPARRVAASVLPGDFVSHAGVDGVGVLDRGFQRAFHPATVPAIAGVVGEPDPIYRADHVVIETLAHLERAEQRPNTAGEPVQGPVLVDAVFERVPRLRVDLGHVLERLG